MKCEIRLGVGEGLRRRLGLDERLSFERSIDEV